MLVVVVAHVVMLQRHLILAMVVEQILLMERHQEHHLVVEMEALRLLLEILLQQL